jgi:UTP-glucose-1-phosphate uridylyltransferase
MNKYIINPNTEIKEALKKISTCGEKCLIVVDNKNNLLGTLSDGDLRKSIINVQRLNKKIRNIYNKNSHYLYENKYNDESIKKLFLEKRLDIIPVVNKKKILVDVILFSKFFKRKNNLKIHKIKDKVKVVIMAGGIGSRLSPFSNILPKPLMPLNNSTLVENIIEKFKIHGFDDFILSLNYKNNLIKSYFNDIKNDFKISYIEEKFPLGTIGPLSKIKNSLNKAFFVVNCDTILDIDYVDLYNFHLKDKNEITIVSCNKEFQIPYGVFKINKKGNYEKTLEKPKSNSLVNVGFYIINSKLFKLIPKNKYFDFNIFLEKVKLSKYKIGFYTVDQSSWKDYGELSKFQVNNL